LVLFKQCHDSNNISKVFASYQMKILSYGLMRQGKKLLKKGHDILKIR
jgi:hypothetical protein